MEQGSILSPGTGDGNGDGVSGTLTAEEIRARLAGLTTASRSSQGIQPDGSRLRGDHDLAPELYPKRALRQAAVLVPLIVREELHVLLTQRTAHLHDHAGQIAFPGGQVDPEDDGVVAAALREAEEEVGLPTSHVEIVGHLDTYLTRTGFEITPVVGLIHEDFEPALDAFEVAEIFEVPLRFFLTPGARETHSRMFEGQERHFYVYPYEERYIWGATAGMINNLSEVLAPKS